MALTPGLTKFSDDAVKLIGAFVDSGAMTNALEWHSKRVAVG